MALLEIRWRPTSRELRQFGVMLAVLLGVSACWGRARGGPFVAALGTASMIVTLLAWLRPQWLRTVYVTWMCVAFPIGWVVSHVLLAAIFYLLLTPLGFVLRWMGYDPLRRGWDSTRESYWEPRSTTPDPPQYFRQF
jgi:hypothetical protein